MKKIAKKIVVNILNWQVRRLRAKHDFKIVVIGGSIGKTSTKFAVSAVLKQKYRIRYQEGNYNDPVTVPLVFFGQAEPSLFNPFAWVSTFLKNEKQIKATEYPFDIVLLEIGTDGPGQLAGFKALPKADLGILTAITPEHMQFFSDLDAVAKEELTIGEVAKKVLANKDLCDGKYLVQLAEQPQTYSVKIEADYQLTNLQYKPDGYEFDFMYNKALQFRATHEAIAESQLYSLCAGAATGIIFGLSSDQIKAGLQQITPVNGRMQRLKGVNDSTIIDDTYNSSPEAVKGALDTLYKIEAPQKIAILGNMNELGTYSASSHTEIGNYCDPQQLELVATIGQDANQYLAPAASQKGCTVKTFTSPYEAANFIKPLIKNGGVILAKGSQNGVFAEEAIKPLLLDPTDASKLVRQNSYWLGVKRKQFGDAK